MSDVAQVRIRPVIDPPCPKHSNVEAIFVCLENGCQESLACPECIIEEGDHNLHKVTLLKKHLDIFKKKINDFNTNTRETVLAPLKVMGSNVADELSIFDPATTTLLENIEARGEKINNHTNTVITELKTKCSEIRASNRQVLEQYQRGLRAKIAEVEADMSVLGNCLTSDCTTDIINAAKTGISKTYPSLEYPNEIQDVSFKESNTPVNAVAKLIGKIRIGNEQLECEEPDDKKIKRLEAQVTDLTQEIERDQALIQKMKKEMMGNAEKLETYQNRMQTMEKQMTTSAEQSETYQTRIQTMEKQMKASAEQMDADIGRRKTLQANNDGLTRELQDQKRDSEKRREELEDKIQELEKRFLCSGCGESKGSCRCKTCPQCSYTGVDFTDLREEREEREEERRRRRRRTTTQQQTQQQRMRRLLWQWRCPKCYHVFW